MSDAPTSPPKPAAVLGASRQSEPARQDPVGEGRPQLEGNVSDSQALAGHIYDELTHAIIRGDLLPGEKLSEPIIARQFGASRAPVREAIRRLQELGLVSYLVNHGVRVIQPSAQDFLALLDVREALEGMAARLAAIHMDDDERDALHALVLCHSAGIEGHPRGAYVQIDPDGDFHRRIVIGSRNPLLADLLSEQFYPRLCLCRRLHATVPGRGREAWREHSRIVDAIRHRDGEMAEILMRRHVRAAKAALLSALEGLGSGDGG
jgi:DNA-binding GntR family transcriptional regulator